MSAVQCYNSTRLIGSSRENNQPGGDLRGFICVIGKDVVRPLLDGLYHWSPFPSAQCRSPLTALMLAAANGELNRLQKFIDEGHHIHEASDVKTALHYAIARKQVESVRMLLNAGMESRRRIVRISALQLWREISKSCGS